jgi:hypothetical protein
MTGWTRDLFRQDTGMSRGFHNKDFSTSSSQVDLTSRIGYHDKLFA